MHRAYNILHTITWISCLHCINLLIKPILPYTQYMNSYNTLVYCFLSMAQLVHDAPLIRMDTSLPTLDGLMRNSYLVSGTQVLEPSITSSCTILHSYRLHPISVLLSMQGSVFWLLGTVVQCGVPLYVRLGGIALEIPVASKLGTPCISSPSLMQLEATICGWSYQLSYCKNCIGEPCNPAQLLYPAQPPIHWMAVDKWTISAWNK